jgi:MoaA/NifB/PqqE/SkfB family radical SAM enzyme
MANYIRQAKNPISKAKIILNYITDMLKIKSSISPGSLDYVLQPISVEIHPTLFCNLDCPPCYFKKARRKVSIPRAIMMNTLRDLNDFGIGTIQLSGAGEPLIYHSIEEVLDFSKDKFGVGIKTSGVYSPDINELLSSINGWVRFSLDATYKKKLFGKVCSNIRELIKLRKTGLRVGIGFLVQKENYHEMQAVLNLASDLEADYVDFRPVIGKQFLPDNKDLEFIVSRLKSNCENNAKELIKSSEEISKGRLQQHCVSPIVSATIGADSIIYACCQRAYTQKARLGSLKKSSFEEIWKKNLNKRLSFEHTKECPSCRFHEVNYQFHGLVMDCELFNFGLLYLLGNK